MVAGTVDAIEQLSSSARDLGLRRIVRLDVAGAFHTPLMEPARVELAAALKDTEFRLPEFPVWTNLNARPVADAAAALAGQLVGTVRFSESLAGMREAGVEAFVHVGPGDVTAGMAKRTVKDAEVITVSSLDDIAAAVERLTV